MSKVLNSLIIILMMIIFGVEISSSQAIISANKSQSAVLDWPINTVDCIDTLVGVTHEFTFFREGGSEIYNFIVNGNINTFTIPLSNFKSGTYYMESRGTFLKSDGTQIIAGPCNSATMEGCVMCGVYSTYKPWKLRIKPVAPSGPIIIE